MPGPVLLVHDDIAVIAAARRLLSREGLEVMLATSVADALIAFGHYQPSLLVVAPAVESSRGAALLEELRRHPDGAQARFVLLGEGVPGVSAPLVPLPLDGALFVESVRKVLRHPNEHHPWQKIALPTVAPVASARAAPLEAMLFGEAAARRKEPPAVAPPVEESEVNAPGGDVPLLSPEPVTPVNALPVPLEALVLDVVPAPPDAMGGAPVLDAEPPTPVPGLGPQSGVEEPLDLRGGVPGAPVVPRVAPARVSLAPPPALGAERRTPVPVAEPLPPLLNAEPRTPIPTGEALAPLQAAEPMPPSPVAVVASPLAEPFPEDLEPPLREVPGVVPSPVAPVVTAGATPAESPAAPRVPARVLSHLPRLTPVPVDGALTAEILPALLASLAELPHTTALVIASKTTQRTLWIQGERIVAIQSRQPSESLLDQARRDGLIDERQESQLQPLRFAPPSAVLGALMERGLVREKEAEPLLERYVDGTAVAALAEPESGFELRRDDPLPVAGVVKSRPLPPLLLAALRQHESVPGVTEATRVAPLWPMESSEAFAPADRERRLLRQLDAELSVAELAQRAGRPVDWVARTVGSWVRLGWVELKAPPREAAVDPHAQASIARLSAKLAASDESDYFSILELPRQVTSKQVREAFQQLAQEFDPARFGTHPDPGVRSRAQHLHSLLEEAAAVLSDDRLRGEYARNLLD